MRLLLSILLFTTSAALAQTQANPQGAPPAGGAAQQAPAGNAPATAQQPGTPPGGQPAAAGAPQSNTGNVASILHVYAYPNGKQSHEQQSQDEAACYQSAESATAGSNQPAAQTAQQGKQPSEAGKGSTVKGSAGGAATGAAIGGVAGDAGQGAAIGAIGGAAVGHRRKKKAQKEAQKEQEQQQQAQQAQATDNLKRAYTACMESRNYTVK